MLLQLLRYNLNFTNKKVTEPYVADTLLPAYENKNPGNEGNYLIDIFCFTPISPKSMAELQRHT